MKKKVCPHEGIKVWTCSQSSCLCFFFLRHWLTCSYILFAVPYFVYDIYAMFLCYWHKLQVKGHEVENGSKSKATAVSGYLRREFLMILHHVVMVTACFPISVVTVIMFSRTRISNNSILTHVFHRICSCSDLLFLSHSLPVLEARKGRLLPGCHVHG